MIRNKAIFATNKVIASLATISNYNVAYNTAYGSNGAGISLPSTVLATFVQGGTQALSITWSIGSYDPLAAFDDDIAYVMNGTLTLPQGITNPNNYQPSVTVTVKDAFFPLASTIVVYWNGTGLVTNVSNTYGTVNSGGNITALKGRAPGGLIDLVSSGTAPTLVSSRINLPDAVNGHLTQSVATTDFDFLYKATSISVLKWTILFTADFADTSGIGGVFGNNGVFAPNGGMAIFADTGGTTDALAMLIANTAGGGTTVTTWGVVGSLVLGAEKLYTIQMDGSLANGSGRVQGWRNTTSLGGSASGSAAPMTTSISQAYDLGDARTGGGGDMAGKLGIFVALNGVETSLVLAKFQADIIAKFGIS